VPGGSYAPHIIDAVNMENGNDIITIPLFSLPQLGKLSLSFSAVGNTTYWTPEYVCTPDGTECSNYFNAISPTYDGASIVAGAIIGPAIVPDNIPFVNSTWFTSPGTCVKWNPHGDEQMSDCYSVYYSVQNSTGGNHPLYYDATNNSNLRTTDGSGFIYESNVPYPYEWGTGFGAAPIGPLIDSKGITYQPGRSPQSVFDRDNNTISISYPGPQYTDSVGRTIPPIPLPTSLTSTPPPTTNPCPNLSTLYSNPAINYQQAVSYAKWVVPGTNNTTATYIICYANIAYHTNFFGDDGGSYSVGIGTGIDCLPGPDGSPVCDTQAYPEISYVESYGTYTAIQSIVLPNGSFWAFVYDAADPNPSDCPYPVQYSPSPQNNGPLPSTCFGYGTVTSVILPEGGSIAYTYGQAGNTCYPSSQGGGPMIVTSRTESDGRGNNYIWQYGIGPISDFTSSIERDPNGNDTLYKYQGSASYWPTNVCFSPMEVSRTQYQGTSTNGTVLQTTTQSYSTISAPLAGGDSSVPGYGNPLPQSVTTTLDSGVSTTTSTSYGGSFAAQIPACGLYYNVGANQWSCINVAEAGDQGPTVTLTLDIPTSTSVTDYSGSLLNTKYTNYLWQNSPNYYAANVLDTPSLMTIYDGQSNQVAQTSITYDETAYSSGSIAGHPTTVLQWNITGPSVATHTGWTNYGMKSYSIDGRGNMSARYTYNYTWNSSQFINLYPSAVTNALGQTTTYNIWDVNTGRPSSITDPNGVVTNNWFADPLGRITLVQDAVGTPQETWTMYSYPNQTTVNVTQDQTAKGDGLLRWSTLADGLGRVIQSTYPNGANDARSYDGLDNATCQAVEQYSMTGNTACTSFAAYTSYQYDGLGRRIVQTNPDQSTEGWAYSGNTVTFTDENHNQWSRTNDALGRLTQVVEPGALYTTYLYDALNDLLCVDQWGPGVTGVPCTSSRTRRFAYDSLARLIQAFNLESGWTCYGTTGGALPNGANCSEGYDGNGNLLSKTDARGVTTAYVYDLGNRVVSKSYSDNTTPWACYLYDSASGGIGRLASEWTQRSSVGSCSSTPPASGGYFTEKLISQYDPMGRLWSETQCTPAGCRNANPCQTSSGAQSYAYDLAGHVTCYTNGIPSTPGAGINPVAFYQTFDPAGRLSSVTTNMSNPLMTLFAAQGYTAFGGLTNATYGSNGSGNNAVTLTRTYDDRQRITSETDLGNSPSSGTNGAAIVTITGTEKNQ
jgi:YD repeat-containing protein